MRWCSHNSGKCEVERTSVIKFIGRMVQQILPPRFKRIRYYGLQSPSNRSGLTAKVCEAVGRLVLLPEIERRSAVPARSCYKDLIELWWGENPLRCKECGHQMELARMWMFGKGWVYNIFDLLFGYDLGPPGNLPDYCGS